MPENNAGLSRRHFLKISAAAGGLALSGVPLTIGTLGLWGVSW